jgi:hypothetical protein
LLKLWEKERQLPQGRVELFRRGCLALCGEVNEKRNERSDLPPVDALRRYSIAARMAAACVFGNRPAFWLSDEAQDKEAEDLSLRELCGPDRDECGDFTVDLTALRGVLRGSALFTLRSTNIRHRRGWEHRSFAEFMAADFAVHRRRWSREQALAVLVDPESGAVWPQLRATAMWMASLLPALRQHFLHSEPTLLLRADPESLPPPERKDLAARVLDGLASGELVDSDDLGPFGALHHPGLASQLQPLLLEARWRRQEQNLVVRRVVIRIAVDCRVMELLPALQEVALDPKEPHQVRVFAAYAILRLGGE